MENAIALLKKVNLLEGDGVHIASFAIGNVKLEIENPSKKVSKFLKDKQRTLEIDIRGCSGARIEKNELLLFNGVLEQIPLANNSVVTLTIVNSSSLGLKPFGNRSTGLTYFTEYSN